jgi:AbiV family abortive infection protein
MTSRRLEPDEVHAIGVAALENAFGLMGDAAILLAADRPRRAYALGVIAVEEAAKHLICKRVLEEWDGTVTVNELNRRLRGGKNVHLNRYSDFLTHLSRRAPWVPLPSGFQNVREMAKEDMRARERALYVEVAPSGAPMTPEGVDEGEARKWVSAMVRWFGLLGAVWRQALDDALTRAQASEV